MFVRPLTFVFAFAERQHAAAAAATAAARRLTLQVLTAGGAGPIRHPRATCSIGFVQKLLSVTGFLWVVEKSRTQQKAKPNRQIPVSEFMMPCVIDEDMNYKGASWVVKSAESNLLKMLFQ